MKHFFLIFVLIIKSMIWVAEVPQQQEKLVKRALQGDEAAFSELYDLYFDKIYRFVYYRVNHKETAEDLVAETFMRVWNQLAKIENVNAFSAWLFQIARNLVIDYYRARKPNLDLQELENILEYEENFLDKTNLALAHKTFLGVFEKLSGDQRLVIKLKFFDELENHEIAKILNKSEGAIRVIQHRAIEALKKLLNHDERT